MQLVYDEYLVDHCWIVRCDHHLDDRLSLYHVSDDRVGSVNNIHWSVATVDDIVDHARQPTTVCAIHTTTETWRCLPRFSGSCRVYDTNRRRYIEDKLLKKVPLTYIATKSEETHVRDRAPPSCKFSRLSARDICLRAKIHIFAYMGLPCRGEGYCPMLYMYRKLSSSWF